MNNLPAKETAMGGDPLVSSLAEKVMETIERTEHLVSLVPGDLLELRPELPVCLSGFCAAFYRAFPVELADFLELRAITVNESCSPVETREKIKLYKTQIQRGFHCCGDDDLARRIPTLFAPEGQTLLTVLLGNLEHLINHKYQLFFHLKLAGLKVGSQDIYRWRRVPEPDGQATVEPE
jgi:hypothetical protein